MREGVAWLIVIIITVKMCWMLSSAYQHGGSRDRRYGGASSTAASLDLSAPDGVNAVTS